MKTDNVKRKFDKELIENSIIIKKRKLQAINEDLHIFEEAQKRRLLCLQIEVRTMEDFQTYKKSGVWVPHSKERENDINLSNKIIAMRFK